MGISHGALGGITGGLFDCLGIPGSLFGVPGHPSGGFVGLWVPLGVLLGVSLGVSLGPWAPLGCAWACFGWLQG